MQQLKGHFETYLFTYSPCLVAFVIMSVHSLLSNIRPMICDTDQWYFSKPWSTTSQQCRSWSPLSRERKDNLSDSGRQQYWIAEINNYYTHLARSTTSLWNMVWKKALKRTFFERHNIATCKEWVWKKWVHIHMS